MGDGIHYTGKLQCVVRLGPPAGALPGNYMAMGGSLDY